MRVWTGYTSQTSCSPVQTWISSNTETPWHYQIAKASLEASRFPLRLKSLWVVFRPSHHFIYLAGRWCLWQRMLVLHLCNRLRSSKTPPHADHLELSLLCCEDWVRFIRSPSRIYRIVFEPYPRRYPFFVKATALDWYLKSALRSHRAWSCASRRFRRPGRLSVGPS